MNWIGKFFCLMWMQTSLYCLTFMGGKISSLRTFEFHIHLTIWYDTRLFHWSHLLFLLKKSYQIIKLKSLLLHKTILFQFYFQNKTELIDTWKEMRLQNKTNKINTKTCGWLKKYALKWFNLDQNRFNLTHWIPHEFIVYFVTWRTHFPCDFQIDIYGMIMVSVVFDFCPCACDALNRETLAGAPDWTLVIVAYDCDEVGKNIAFGCKRDVDLVEEPAQFGSGRPTMMQDWFVFCFECGWLDWRAACTVVWLTDACQILKISLDCFKKFSWSKITNYWIIKTHCDIFGQNVTQSRHPNTLNFCTSA